MGVEAGIPFLLAVVFGAGVLVSSCPIARQVGGKWFFDLLEAALSWKPLIWSRLVSAPGWWNW
jgi:hypothetical protein